MAIYMPPIARKKAVPEKYNPDTYRVISVDAETFHPKFESSVIKPVYEGDIPPTRKILPDIPVRKTRVLNKPVHDFRANNPQPARCGFLESNVMMLNEPICTVYTKDTHEDQCNWWPHRTSKEPLHQPEHTLDSTYRNDFLFEPQNIPAGSNRHLANPNKEPALGAVTKTITNNNIETDKMFVQTKKKKLSADDIHCQIECNNSVPVNLLRGRDGKQCFYKENISYEHQYNSRNDQNYPIRSKRHGAFVWNKMSSENQQKFIEHQEMMKEYEANVKEQQSNQPCDSQSDQQEPATQASPRQSDKSANNSVRSSMSQMSIQSNKKMTPIATPLIAATTDGINQNSPQESIFYEQDVATQTSPNNRDPTSSPAQMNLACDSTH